MSQPVIFATFEFSLLYLFTFVISVSPLPVEHLTWTDPWVILLLFPMICQYSRMHSFLFVLLIVH